MHLDLHSFPTRRSSDLIVVGNESVLRDEVDVDDLIEIIKRVKRQVPVPVTTGETHDVWRGLYTREAGENLALDALDRKSTRLNSSHVSISYAVFCLKKK